MKLSLSWLKNYVSIKLSPDALAHKLTMAGLEVKGTEKSGSDTIFEIEVTPNRSDCLSVLGAARETSAITNQALKFPKIKSVKLPSKKCSVTIVDKNDCGRYIGIVVKNVSVKSSPDWLKKHIESVGLRPINNIVDITNFVLLETGQPLHAFDYDRLSGGNIIVRRAKDGEKLTTIDGVERKLDSSVLAIADEKNPVAIAGIMGGKATEVTETTKNILLESAYFDPILIRRAARKLALTSDSSYRFERGVDINNVSFGSQRALSLILELAGGTVDAASDVFPMKGKNSARNLNVSILKINDLLGINVPAARIKDILIKLGFKIASAKKDILKIIIPSFRNDIKEDVDIMEEAARIVGYEHIPTTLPLIKASVISKEKNFTFRENISNTLVALGLNEAVGYSMTSEKFLQRSGFKTEQILKVKNPLSIDQEMMRPSLLISLLPALSLNINRGQKNIKLFEVGKTYNTNDLEKESVGIILSGLRREDWRQKREDVDFYDLKGTVEGVLHKNDVTHVEFAVSEQRFFDTACSADILIEGEKIGVAGKLSSQVLSNWDIKQRGVYFAELDAQVLQKYQKPKLRFEPLSEFPVVVRDISLAVKNQNTFSQIEHLAYQTGGELLKSVRFVEQYTGDKIPSGHRGIVLSLLYQSSERTLREEEINAAHEKVCQKITSELGAIRR